MAYQNGFHVGDASGALANLSITSANQNKLDKKRQLAATFWDASTVPSLGQKRQDYIEWSDYFMAIAFLSAQRSKDPNTQVGACIVNRENKIVGIGYNGMPNGCSDEIMPWGNDAHNELDKKSMYVCHAELNAVLNKNSADVKNCTIYTALFPCNECAKIIIQSGIREVIYYSDKYRNKDSFIASRRMFELAGIKYRQHQPKMKKIVIDFDCIENGHKPS